MDTLNGLLTRLGDVLLSPFRNYPTLGLVFWSAVTGVIMTYVFGWTSNQRALRRAADTIRAQLFAVKLFKEDLLVTFQCQVKLLKSTGRRLVLSIPPMLVMILPLLLVLTQLAMRYEFRPLVDGQRAVVAMHVYPDHWKEARDATLLSGKGYVVETPGLRDERNGAIFWRVRAAGSAPAHLTWVVDGHTVQKAFPVAETHDMLVVANPKRPGGSVWDQVLYPAEARLSAEVPVRSIDVQLSPRETRILGWNVPWWATFFVVSIVIAFVAGMLLHVQY